MPTLTHFDKGKSPPAGAPARNLFRTTRSGRVASLPSSLGTGLVIMDAPSTFSGLPSAATVSLIPDSLPITLDRSLWARRAVRGHDVDSLEAGLVRLAGGNGEVSDEIDLLAARVHGRSINRVHTCMGAHLPPEVQAINVAITFGILRTRVFELKRAQTSCILIQLALRESLSHIYYLLSL